MAQCGEPVVVAPSDRLSPSYAFVSALGSERCDFGVDDAGAPRIELSRRHPGDSIESDEECGRFDDDVYEALTTKAACGVKSVHFARRDGDGRVATTDYVAARVAHGGFNVTSRLGSRLSQIITRVGRTNPRRLETVARALTKRREMT